jgi:hypothetical protein
MENIKQILREENIQEHQIPYFYTNKNEFCCDIDLESMYSDIKDFDYLEPIKRLAEYYKSKYYKKLIKQTMKYFLTKEYGLDAPLYIQQHHYLFDEILLQYVKCFSTMSAMIVYPLSNITNIYDTQFYKELKQNGQVHGIKEMILTNKQVRNMIYQVYYNKDGFKKMKVIKGKQERSGATETNNRFFIIFYKAKKFSEISGKDAPLKVKLRNILQKESGKMDKSANFFLHITDNNTECIELAQLFCNKNSMRLIYHQRLERILENKFFYKPQVILMTFKNWLYQEVHPLDHIRFMIVSSMILYSLGLRPANDLDMVIHHLPENNIKTKDFMNKVDKFLEQKDTKFPFADILMKNIGKCANKDNEKLCEWYLEGWPNNFGAIDMEEVILNPKYHYYYFGIKFISIKADLKRRINRTRPASYADLIAFKHFIYNKQLIPHLPKGYWQQQQWYEMTDEYIDTLYSKIQWYLKRRYQINMSKDEIKELVRKSE